VSQTAFPNNGTQDACLEAELSKNRVSLVVIDPWKKYKNAKQSDLDALFAVPVYGNNTLIVIDTDDVSELTDAVDAWLVIKSQQGAYCTIHSGGHNEISEVEKLIRFNRATCRWEVYAD
jgi:hypothetical protein